jgi:LacI family transcriptional regulator
MFPNPSGSYPLLRYILVALRSDGIPAITLNRPRVGLLIDGFSAYGRTILRGISRYANLQRRWLLFKELQRFMNDRSAWPQFDGIIVAGAPPDVFLFAREHCANVVMCSGGGDPKVTPVVALDEDAGAEMAAKHLIECRLERFAFYGNKNHVVYPVRFAGFQKALEAAGYTCLECPVSAPGPDEWMMHAGRPALTRWLLEIPKPIGIMALDDSGAHDLAEACLEADIAVPEQVAIIGLNNDELMCECAWPPLSSVDPDYSRIGYAAAKILDRLLSGEKLGEYERMTRFPPIGVVARQSTNVLAISNPNLALAMRFIREHACQPCTVRDILQVVPVGRRWLEQQFTRHLGRSPHDEITRMRIETAERLLMEPDLSVDDIASRCGYAEIKSFYTAFRKVTKTTPAAYRRARITQAK